MPSKWGIIKTCAVATYRWDTKPEKTISLNLWLPVQLDYILLWNLELLYKIENTGEKLTACLKLKDPHYLFNYVFCMQVERWAEKSLSEDTFKSLIKWPSHFVFGRASGFVQKMVNIPRYIYIFYKFSVQARKDSKTNSVVCIFGQILGSDIRPRTFQHPLIDMINTHIQVHKNIAL